MVFRLWGVALLLYVVCHVVKAEDSGGLSIRDLDKPTLLRALWESSKVAAFYGGGTGPEYDMTTVQETLQNGSIDYYCGRAIKMDLRRDVVDPYLYDRSSPKRTAQSVIESVRKGEFPKVSDRIEPKWCRGCVSKQTTNRYRGYPVCPDCQRMFEKFPDLFQMILFQKADEL